MYEFQDVLSSLQPDLKLDEFDIIDVYSYRKTDEGVYDFSDDENEVILEAGQLVQVSIVTTDWGPFLNDVFLLLYTGDTIYCIEQEAPFYQLLYTDISQVPGFDYDAVIKAMQSTENAEFICWRKGDSAPEKNREVN